MKNRFLLIPLFLCSMLLSCSLKRTNLTPSKPTSVPSGAFWKGGIDGGHWFLVKDIHPHQNMAEINIYNDYDGSLVTASTFILVCSAHKQSLIEDLPNQIDNYDGEKISLIKSATSNCYLQPKRKIN